MEYFPKGRTGDLDLTVFCKFRYFVKFIKFKIKFVNKPIKKKII